MAGTNPSLSLIVAVYNAAPYLEFIFEALGRQSFRNFEVIVADDGSGPEVRQVVDRVRDDFTSPLQHLWQEDAGFRKNVMLNKSITAAKSDYLVFIDGDCVPHRHFLNDHWLHHEPNTVLCGRRMNLSKQLTGKLTIENIRSGDYERLSPSVWLDGLMARSSNLEDAIRIENPFVRKMLHRNQARILGCNFSVERKLLEGVNGFNEEYQAPGIGEDTDVAFRLNLIGARFATLRYLAILYHLFHPPTQVGAENKRIFDEVVREGNPLCRNGLRKLEVTTD